ncbi:MAG: hypothetical protein A3E87_04550 [Gammaproteobacteria bacterium RIFCSPHIGHO2_12_FULL_35_23]|nr:MAG: hypothetical protein A3E87_04550 [Gammaproteobacteria bacterium RIFCSPHIGHO2_12_FULL_35_23]
MSKIRIRRLLGIAGVAETEPLLTQQVAFFFEWYMLCIAFWLPIQWYLEIQGDITFKLMLTLDWFVWFSFAIETLTLGIMVKNKKDYFTGNWLNLLIIVVAFPLFYSHVIGLGILRTVRLLILLRIIVPWLRSAHNMLTLNRVGLTLLVFFIATTFSGIFVSTFDSGITNPFQGIWWAWETVTTVGYGDVIPTTPAGKVIAMVIMVLGIVLFSVVTATISAYFVGRDKKTELYSIIQANRNCLKNIEESLRLLHYEKITFKSLTEAEKFIQQLLPADRQLLLKALQQLNAENK